jgi:hypothetical protein
MCNKLSIPILFGLTLLLLLSHDKDAITGNVLHLKEQTILIHTREEGGKGTKMNARELAHRLRHCRLNDTDAKFDSELGMWYDVGFLVVARPGSGKTWLMQQIVHFMCEEYLTVDFDNPSRFVPVLFSVQRIARLYRKYCVRRYTFLSFFLSYRCVFLSFFLSYRYFVLSFILSYRYIFSFLLTSSRNDPIRSQTDALELLEVILRWDYDGPTVDAILGCYGNRTLVILLDGLDEASSLAHVFESLGVFLAKSGNRVVMAARPEGINSQNKYSNREGWTLLDLPELSVEQQAAIAYHQIDNLDGSFFNRFYQFQDSRNALDAAADKCLVDEGELSFILSGITFTKMELVPKAVLNCNTLSEVGLIFNEEEDFCQKHVTDPLHKEVLRHMKDLYERAKVDKSQLDGFLDTLRADLQIASVVKAPLKKPKQLLEKAARNNGLHNVTAVEGAVVCDDWTEMKHVLRAMIGSKSMCVHHIHNGFQDLDFIHYRCVNMTVSIETSPPKNCVLKLPSGEDMTHHPVVIQIHLRTMYELLPSCEEPRHFFLAQGGLCGDEVQRMECLKKRMDVVHAIGRIPVLLSVFLMFIRACTSRLSSEERDETVDVHTCPPMPPSLHYLYQEALWGGAFLEARDSSSSQATLLEVLERVAFENMKHG